MKNDFSVVVRVIVTSLTAISVFYGILIFLGKWGWNYFNDRVEVKEKKSNLFHSFEQYDVKVLFNYFFVPTIRKWMICQIPRIVFCHETITGVDIWYYHVEFNIKDRQAYNLRLRYDIYLVCFFVIPNTWRKMIGFIQNDVVHNRKEYI
jgi:hypothetical protein